MRSRWLLPIPVLMKSESRFPVSGSLITWLRLTVTILITRLASSIVASLLNLVLALASARRIRASSWRAVTGSGVRDLRQVFAGSGKSHLASSWHLAK